MHPVAVPAVGFRKDPAGGGFVFDLLEAHDFDVERDQLVHDRAEARVVLGVAQMPTLPVAGEDSVVHAVAEPGDVPGRDHQLGLGGGEQGREEQRASGKHGPGS